MAIKVLDKDGKEKSQVELPLQFKEELREDLIQRAVLAIQSHKRQPYGASPEAGKRHSAELSRRRRKYRGSYGSGISRVPRKIHTRRGTRMYWVGAVAPGTVGGRRAHPPKAEKIWSQKINNKERQKAIRCALSATMNKDIVNNRGHKVPENYPFILDESFEKLGKTKDIKESLIKLNLADELQRASEKSIRPTKGKSRGRKYRKKIGPLLVVGNDCELIKSASNLPGIDIVHVKNINAELLAPGCHQGRLTLFTQSAIQVLEKDKLFM